MSAYEALVNKTYPSESIFWHVYGKSCYVISTTSCHVGLARPYVDKFFKE